MNVVSTKTYENPDCKQLFSEGANSCEVKTTLFVSEEQTVQLEEIQHLRSTMNAFEFSTFSEKVAAGEVKSKNYNQQINQISDSQTQRGTFYYDGEQAWVTDTYKGYTGFHECVVDWAVAYGVELRDCSESGSLQERRLNMTWHYRPLANPLLGWDESYSLYVDASGNIREG